MVPRVHAVMGTEDDATPHHAEEISQATPMGRMEKQLFRRVTDGTWQLTPPRLRGQEGEGEGGDSETAKPSQTRVHQSKKHLREAITGSCWTC